MRRRTNARTILPETLVAIFEDSTYGGSKYSGKHAKRPEKQMPVVANQEGVKVEWGPGEEEYPVFVSLKMTDGSWMKYQIHREQPAPKVSPALEDVANMSQGYPRRRP